MAPRILFLLATICVCISATRPSGSIQDVAHSLVPKAPDLDLDGPFPDHLKQVLNLIEKAKTLPSCAKTASSALLHSCSTLGGSVDHHSDLPPGSDLLIEEESGIYAARLAVCELKDADFIVPTECRSFVPTSGEKKTTTFGGWISSKSASKPRIMNDYYDEVTEANLKQCRKALGSSSQAWTSYSNNRQNAVAMCHAMQSAVERDESRHVAKILATTAAAAGETLQEAYEQASEIKHLFHELRTAIPDLQKDLATFDEDIHQAVQQYWDQLRQAQSGIDSLAASIDLAQDGMKQAHDHLDAVLSKHLPELGLAISKARQETKDAFQDATAATELIAYRVELIQQDMVKGLSNAGMGLTAINELMPQFNHVIQSTIDNTLKFYEAAAERQLALNSAQNDTIDGLERIDQKTESLSSKVDGVASKMTNMEVIVDKLDPLLGPLATFLQSANTSCILLVYSFAFGLCSIAFWHDCIGCSLAASRYAAFGSGMAFASALNVFWNRTARDDEELVFESDSRLSSKISVFLPGIAISLLVLLLTIAIRYVLRRSSETSPPSDEYDPTSPPYGIREEDTQWSDDTKLEGVFVDHPSPSFMKRRV